MSGILRLESLTKGNTLKQGDKTPLKYRLFDADGEKLNIAGKSAKVRLVYPDFLTIGYEKDGLTVAQDDTVTFTIDKLIPAKLYHVEIIVDEKYIFPSRADESKFTVDKSSLGTESNIVEIVGVDAVVRKAVDLINQDPSLIIDEDKLVTDIISNTGIGSIEEYYRQFTDVLKELSKDQDYHSLPEIAVARGGFDTLGERLDDPIPSSRLKTLTNSDKIQLINLSDEVKQSMAGTTPINAIVGNGEVTPEKTSFLHVKRINLADPSKITEGAVVSQTTGELTASGSANVSDFIEVEEGKTYKTNGTWDSGYYDVNKQFVQGISGFNGDLTVPKSLNIKYVRIAFSNGQLERGSILVEGTELPDEFIPYSEYSIEIVDREIEKAVFDVVDEKLVYEPITLDQTNFFKSERINLVDSNKISTGMAVDITNGTLITHELSNTSDFIRVEEGKTYRTNGTYHSGLYDVDGKFVQPLADFHGEFTVPTSSGIEFVRVAFSNGQLANGAMLVEGTTLPHEFVPYDRVNMKFRSETLKKSFAKELEQALTGSGLWELKWNALGDSITAPDYAYHKHISTKNNMNVRNYGISGTRISVVEGIENPMCERYINMDDDADIITVFGGTNDYGSSVPIGTIDSTDKTTLMGALNVLCSGLIQKYPGKKIGFITPMQRANMDYAKMNSYVTAIKEVCGKYSIPVLDTMHGGGIYPNDATIKATYIPDGLHPNEEGHKVIARRIEAFIKSL